MKQENIRNFSIIAHIDHGKSTLADRLIELCGGLSAREMSSQVLDSMDIERERGITIKAQSVALKHKYKGETYQLNIIDTPGHVDFSYEVSRSLAACEGALLLVDASQGVEAQTVSVCYMAMEQNIKIIPVLNKIDLDQADPDKVKKEIEEIVGIDASSAIEVSAKNGIGVKELLDSLITEIDPPKGDKNAPCQALIVDSWFDSYLGVVSLVRIVNGEITTGEKIKVMSTGKVYNADQLGNFTPKRTPIKTLHCGEVGYLISGIKDIKGAPVGDTITILSNESTSPLPGFDKVQPKVYAGLYPIDSAKYEVFRDALSKLKLNDSSLFYEPERTDALGLGFRCGFLGLLHMEIVQERLEREYSLELITTAPTVIYEVLTTKNEIIYVDSPSKLPSPAEIAEIREPIVEMNIITPSEYVGAVMQLCIDRRGVQKKIYYFEKQVSISYELPMGEVIFDFYDQLKSNTRGYASMEYNFVRFSPENLVKLDILINGETVDSLSLIIHKQNASYRGRELTEKLAKIIPRQMFEIALQAAIGSHIIARSSIKALRKNVTAKCYGGDVSRKRKLLEKQKAGKKRMKQIGKISIPQEAFVSILRVKKEKK